MKYVTHIFFWVVLLICIRPISVQAQDDLSHQAPSLQLGLDGLTFGKGTLDAQLIMEIIAEKQQELKLKAIQNIFLSKVENAGGAVYSFTNNVVKELVTEKDQAIRTKKIMENTVNLVFVVAYLEYFLREIKEEELTHLNLLATEYGYEELKQPLSLKSLVTSSIHNIKKSENRVESTSSNIKENKEVEFIALLLDMSSEVVRRNEKLKQLGLMQVSYSTTYEYMNLYLDFDKCDQYEKQEDKNECNEKRRVVFNALSNQLETITNNIGLVNYMVEQYSFRNDKLAAFKNKEEAFNNLQEKQAQSLGSAANTIREIIVDVLGSKQPGIIKAKEIQTLVILSQKVDEIIQKNTTNGKFIEEEFDEAKSLRSMIDSLNKLKSINDFDKRKIEELEVIYTILNKRSGKVNQAILIKVLARLESDLKETITESTKEKQDTITQNEIKNLTTIYFYVHKARTHLTSAEDLSVLSDIVYTFYSEFIPLLKNQSYRSARYVPLIELIDSTSGLIVQTLLQDSQYHIDFKYINGFLLIASKLYQFDKASTISEYLKLIDEVGYIFPDDNIRQALSTVVSFIKDYTVTEKNGKGKEVISFNVESYLMKLQNIKPYKHHAVQFHFTVGLNNAYFNKPLLLNDSTTLHNLSYVGEKIGIKLKIKDWGFYLPRNPGETYKFGNTVYVKTTPPREPLVSNVHLLLYGSGILYNLVNAKTNSEFNLPMAGVGAGVTFSNALDFNISWGIPIFSNRDFSESFEYTFVNLGFDIQFIEYYNRLIEKRDANRTQKRLAKAASK